MYDCDHRSLGVIGQFRPKKLISSIKGEFTSDDGELPSFKDVAMHFLDKSLYALGLSTQFALTPSTSIKWSAEQHGEKKGRRQKLMIFQKACACSELLFVYIVIIYKHNVRNINFHFRFTFMC